MATEEEDILLSIGFELEDFKKKIGKLNKEFNILTKANTFWNFDLSEKEMKIFFNEYNKNIKDSAKVKSKILSDYNKQEHSYIEDIKKAEAKSFNYKNELMANSFKKEAKFYSDMSNIRVKEYKDSAKVINKEAKADADLRSRESRRLFEERISQAKKEATLRKEIYNKSMAGAMEHGTTFGHKLYTTASYAAAGALIWNTSRLVQEGFSLVATQSVKFDDALYNNIAVLNATRKEAEDLADSATALGIAYGGSIEDINQVVLTLGRAGVATTNLKDATTAVVELATITGDTFDDTSKVVSSFITNFESAGVSVDELANKLGYMANESKMSTADLGTFANYGLQTATMLGLNIDAVGGLATGLSNLGINASTIGTQIQKLNPILNSSANNISKFWDILGQKQSDVAKAIRDPKTGSQALIQFINDVNAMGYDKFIDATRNLEINQGKLLASFFNGSEVITKHIKNIKDAGDVTAQAAVKALGASALWQKALNYISSAGEGVVTNVLDFFTDRDEIALLSESLKYLEKGSAEYIRLSNLLKKLLKDSSAEKPIESIDNYNKQLQTIGKQLEDNRAKAQNYFLTYNKRSDDLSLEYAKLISEKTQIEIALKKLQTSGTKGKQVDPEKLREESYESAFNAKEVLLRTQEIAKWKGKIAGIDQSALKTYNDRIKVLDAELKVINATGYSREKESLIHKNDIERLRAKYQLQVDIGKEEKDTLTATERKVRSDIKVLDLLRKQAISIKEQENPLAKKSELLGQQVKSIKAEISAVKALEDTEESRNKLLQFSTLLSTTQNKQAKAKASEGKKSLEYQQEILKLQGDIEQINLGTYSSIENRKNALKDSYNLEVQEALKTIDLEERKAKVLALQKQFRLDMQELIKQETFASKTKDEWASVGVNALQDMLDGDFNFSNFASGLAKEVGNSMATTAIASGDIAQLGSGVAGIGFMAVGSIMSNLEKTEQELNNSIIALKESNERLYEASTGEGTQIFDTMSTELFEAISNYKLASNNLKNYSTNFNAVGEFFNILDPTTNSLKDYKKAVNDAEANLNNMIVSVIDSAEAIDSFGEKFGNLYDKLTGTTTFSDIQGQQALSKVQLQFGMSLENLLKKLAVDLDIENIAQFKEDLANKVPEALWKAQIAFNKTGEEAINMFDEISLATDYQAKLNESTRERAKSDRDMYVSQHALADSITETTNSMMFLSKRVTGFNDELPTTVQGILDLRKAFYDNDGIVDEFEQTIIDTSISTKKAIDAEKELAKERENAAYFAEVDWFMKLKDELYNTQENTLRYLLQQLNITDFYDKFLNIDMSKLPTTADDITDFIRGLNVELTPELESLTDIIIENAKNVQESTEETEKLNQAILDERASLQEQYDILTGVTTQRDVELSKLDESNRKLQIRIWNIEHENEVAEENARALEELSKLGEERLKAQQEQAKAIENEKASLQEQYDLLTGVTTQRDIELSKLDESNRALQESIWLEEDRKEAIDNYSAGISESIVTTESTLESLTNKINELRGSSTGGVSSLLEFNAAMQETLALKDTEDYKALNDSVQNTLELSSALMDEANFSSLRDMQFAQLVAANQLESVSTEQLSQLDILEQISDTLDTQSIIGVGQYDTLDDLVDKFGEDGIFGDIKEYLASLVDIAENPTVEQNDAGVNVITLGADEVITPTITQVELTIPTILPAVEVTDTIASNSRNTILDRIRERFPGFATGGYTGDMGAGDIAGLVHGKEFVVNAPTTKALGLNDGNGGVFKEMLNENKLLRVEMVSLNNKFNQLLEVQNISLEELQLLGG